MKKQVTVKSKFDLEAASEKHPSLIRVKAAKVSGHVLLFVAVFASFL